jgi:hypothetical protein
VPSEPADFVAILAYDVQVLLWSSPAQTGARQTAHRLVCVSVKQLLELHATTHRLREAALRVRRRMFTHPRPRHCPTDRLHIPHVRCCPLNKNCCARSAVPLYALPVILQLASEGPRRAGTSLPRAPGLAHAAPASGTSLPRAPGLAHAARASALPAPAKKQQQQHSQQ